MLKELLNYVVFGKLEIIGFALNMLVVNLLLLYFSTYVAGQFVSTTEDCSKSFTDVVRGGLWDCAKSQVEKSVGAAGETLLSILDTESRMIMKELANLKKVLESSLPTSVISPAYQWAQSPDEVFLNVKFAHKLDTPATLNVEAQNVSLSERNLFLFASDGRKNFALNITFLKDIVPDESSWSMASVGRMTFNLKKTNSPSNWARLLKDKSKKTGNAHFWYEMHERHAAALAKLDDESDDESEKEKKKVKPDKKPEVAKPSTETASDTVKKEEEQAPLTPLQETIEKLTKEHKEKVSQAELETKERKKAIDLKAKEEKKKIDEEGEQSVKLLTEEFNKAKADVENIFASKPAIDKDL